MKRFLTFLFFISLAFFGGAPAINAKPQKIKSVRITVSQAGYSPAFVRVKKGQRVRLVFYRADANNCGDEIVFPALNIKRQMPVRRPVVVTLTPRRAGEISFTCGMDMYRGKVLVTN